MCYCRYGLMTALALVATGLIISGGTGTAISGVIANALGVGTGLASFIGWGMFILITAGLGFSGALDWICCEYLSQDNCCPQPVTRRFWNKYREIIESGEQSEEDCEELRRILRRIRSDLDGTTLQSLENITAELCGS